MACSIGKSMEDKRFSVRMANIGLDVIRTFNSTNSKRADSFKKCAVEQLDFVIQHDENQSYVRECERVKEVFLDILEDTGKYYCEAQGLIDYLNTFVLMGIR